MISLRFRGKPILNGVGNFQRQFINSFVRHRSSKSTSTKKKSPKKPTPKENFVQQRDNEWIGYSMNDTSFESLSGIESIPDLIYNKDSTFKDAIDLALFDLESLYKRKHFLQNFINENLIKEHSNVCLNSFQHSLTLAMKFYKSSEIEDIITLEDLISPTITRLPHIVYQINQQKPSKFLINFFQMEKILNKRDQILNIFIKAYQTHTLRQTSLRIPSQGIKLDIKNPAEWYPIPRKVQRKLILHVGPTNSGKTYRALQRLKTVERGYFAGPLRLLAREIYERFQKEGIRCNLITGEEIIHDIDSYGNSAGLSSGTVEMISMTESYDVVVLDEIQMIGDNDRGWAWTNALLGVNAKELHLCGEASVVPLIKKIAEITGDEVIINEYQRLGELKCEEKPLRGIQDLKTGDCIVVFSKKKILSYKTDIEKKTNLKCAVVYGALPAETRVAQAAKFNNGEVDVLIATDAIGMGLNLKINRIIFDQHKKFDGKNNVPIATPQIKQIAGRAGRFKVAPSATYDKEMEENDSKDTSIGYVNAFDNQSLTYVRDQLALPSTQLQQGYLWPSDSHWAHYMSEYVTGTPFVKIIKNFANEVDESKYFTIANIDNRIAIVSLFQNLKNLLVDDQLRISTAPISIRLPNFQDVLWEFCDSISKSKAKNIFQYQSLDFSILETKTKNSNNDKEILEEMEILHKYLMVWLWMNIRYPTIFVDRESAIDLKNALEDRIEDTIDNLRAGNDLIKLRKKHR